MKNSIQNSENFFSAVGHHSPLKLINKNTLNFTPFCKLRLCAVAIFSLLVFIGCSSDPEDLLLHEESVDELFSETPSNVYNETAGIFDGANGGTEGFYFLPPMVKSPSYTGTFDSALTPVVEICETKECLTLHASFSMDGGEGSELVRLDEENAHYIVNWHTDQTGTEVGKTYRIRISVAGTVLGHADIQMASNGQEAKNLTDNEAIALVDGRTLPVKFRIEKGAVHVVGSEGGAFSTADGLVNLGIPANAVNENIGITVIPGEDNLNDPDVVPGAVFDFGPSPYNFNETLTLTIKYDPANLPAGVSEDELRLLAVVDGDWVQLPGSFVDVVNSTVTGPLGSFSRKGVGRGKPHQITVAPADLSIAVGETVQFEAVLTDVDGQVISRNVQWSSSDAAIATVDNSGVATALAPGEVAIEVKSGKFSGSANLIVAAANGSSAFVTKWDTNLIDGYSNTIYLGFNYGITDVTIDWGDGEVTTLKGDQPYSYQPAYHTYSQEGVYNVSVTGSATAYTNGHSQEALIEVVAWGNLGLESLVSAFKGAKNLIAVPATTEGLEGVTNMSRMFEGASSFNDNIGNWNVSNVTHMASMFTFATTFNQDIGAWNTSNVTTMANMFSQAYAFNQNIGGWDTGNVLDMSFMFNEARSFNQDIGNWNTVNVTNMWAMFNGAINFNPSIGGWNTGNVTDMSFMFARARVFDQDLRGWDTGKVRNMQSMFALASAFNQDIGGWNTGNVSDMSGMFSGATASNRDIGGWKTGNVMNMNRMFRDATSFNHSLSRWCVSKITNEPTDFDTGATNWALLRPIWGTCP